MRSLKTLSALYGLEQNVGYPRNSNSSKTSSTEHPVLWYFEITTSNSSNFGAALYTPFIIKKAVCCSKTCMQNCVF